MDQLLASCGAQAALGHGPTTEAALPADRLDDRRQHLCGRDDVQDRLGVVRAAGRRRAGLAPLVAEARPGVARRPRPPSVAAARFTTSRRVAADAPAGAWRMAARETGSSWGTRAPIERGRVIADRARITAAVPLDAPTTSACRRSVSPRTSPCAQ